MAALERSKSGSYKARKGIPKDVREEYQRLYGPGWEAKLRLPAGLLLQQAKARHGEWLAEIETRIATIRARRRGEGQPLTKKDAHALAGEWYRWFIARHENDPGSPEGWDMERDALVSDIENCAPKSFGLGPPPTKQEWQDWRETPDARIKLRPIFADYGHTAQFLASKGIVLTDEARDQFLDCVDDELWEALGLLERRAGGDYSPDTRVARFPKFTVGKRKVSSGLGPWELFERWVHAREPATQTVTRWRAVFVKLRDDFSEAEISEDDARAWINGLKTERRTAHTVSAVWYRAAYTVYAWALGEKLIPDNPFAEVSVTVPRKVQTREGKEFKLEEIRTILQGALAVTPGKSAFKAACRWAPWLCAYSGARIGEITQLRGKDIERRGEIVVMRLTPEAGTIKGGKPRVVPLHEHLLEQGFLDYVSARGEGPLFYDPEEADDTVKDATSPRRPRRVKARERLASWVRNLGVTAPEIRPNHAWRHTFRIIAQRHRLTENIIDAICDHKPVNVGRIYQVPPIEDMAEEIRRFPRYDLG